MTNYGAAQSKASKGPSLGQKPKHGDGDGLGFLNTMDAEIGSIWKTGRRD